MRLAAWSSRLGTRLQSLRSPWLALTLALLASLQALVGGGLLPAQIDSLDRLWYDTQIRERVAAPDDRVLIVDVDESSLARVGRWPWDRSTTARLLSQLGGERGAAAIGVDMLFAEPQPEAGQDEQLAQALERLPVVLGYYFNAEAHSARVGQLPAPVLGVSEARVQGHQMTVWQGYSSNLARFMNAGVEAGFFNPVVDPDGVVRALPVLAAYRSDLYQSFAVAVLRRALGGAALQLGKDELVLQGDRGQARLPLSDGLTALVPFARPSLRDDAQRFRRISAADVLEGRFDRSLIAGRIVLVGTSAPGLTDLRATPLRATYPGIDIHASLISAALDADSLERSMASRLVAAATIALAGVLLALLLPRAGPAGIVGASAFAGLVLWWISAIALRSAGLVAPPSLGAMLIVALAGLHLGIGYLKESQVRREVSELFGEYVSPELVTSMVRNPAKFGTIRSESRSMTILFVDIRGFTSLAETLPPEQLREYLNAFLSAMTDVIHAHRGTVDKYIGDAVMAFWGAPLEDAAHADHAVTAALDMLVEVERLSRHLTASGLPALEAGIGINSGTVVVGDMGSRLRRAYTVIGDAVNVAARLQGLSRQFGVRILVGDETRRLATSHGFVALGDAQVAGRHDGLAVHTPSAALGDACASARSA